MSKYTIDNVAITPRQIWKRDALQLPQTDWLAQEIPVALVYNGISHVVMMASPMDLEHFAVGFSLSEGIIESVNEIYDIALTTHPQGIEIHIELASRRFMALKAQRRGLIGRTGCGICGTEQLKAVIKPISPLPFHQHFPLALLDNALQQLDSLQPLCQLTGCTHAAAWLTPKGQIAAVHEDVGRHVALDKLLGRRAREHWPEGAALISSRASYEMVQKAAICGIEILFAVSAATTLAVELAEQCGLTLVGFSRTGRATIYTFPQRLN